MKKINSLINIFAGSIFGVYVGRCIYDYWFYRTHPEIYMFFSAPWYTDILLHGAVAVIAILPLLIAKFFVKKRISTEK